MVSFDAELDALSNAVLGESMVLIGAEILAAERKNNEKIPKKGLKWACLGSHYSSYPTTILIIPVSFDAYCDLV